MRQTVARVQIFLSLVLAIASCAMGEDGSAGVELFESRIRPVLVEACYSCHSADADTIEGELTLDNRAALARGGRSGPVIEPGDPNASRLLSALKYDDPALQMPPGGKLPDAVIADFNRWIEQGAPDPREGQAAEIDSIASRAESHWAFQLPTRPEIPSVESNWPAKPLDNLILTELAKEGLSPSLQASRSELIRRLYFDLIGLAPNWQQVRAFQADESPDAYQKVVDQLLSSPQFGERWARHWLDVARFADTKGYVFTEKRDFPSAYKYRDWVIGAFNDDMPIDRFLMYQIAADLMVQDSTVESSTVEGSADKGNNQRQHLAAQGYITLGRRFINNPHDIIADRIDVVFRGMMGMTVACARCHDHKFDPISDEDYYALYGMFASSKEVQDEDLPLRLVDKEDPKDVGLFIRGNAHNRGAIVPRGVPQFFDNTTVPLESGSGRLELAESIADAKNPLTARVFVNRVWGHLFGEQLVSTPSDFGLRSEVPRQQAVLDLLATDFISNNWSLKWLIRELVMSSTYRQRSQANAELIAADPENLLWGRMNRRRLDFEAMRDGLLKVSGRLDERVGGESERIDTGQGGTRRTLYAHIDRQNLPGQFRAFDFASPDAHCPERPHTLVPQQPLFLLNGTMSQIAARDLAASLTCEDPAERIAELYHRVLARDPSEYERTLGLQFLEGRQAESIPPDEWSFGYGAVRSDHARATVQLRPLDHFLDNRWQATREFPQKPFGHLSVTPSGGHPGDLPKDGAIRRWTAPAAGSLTINSSIERPSEKGDGVVATVVSSRRGVVANWVLQTGKQQTEVKLPSVEVGETIDFVVSCRENPSYDSFQWKLSLKMETSSGLRHWSSERDFHGPHPEPLDLWAQLAQVLLVSNEFLFID